MVGNKNLLEVFGKICSLRVGLVCVDICRVYNLFFPNVFVGSCGLVFHLLCRVASALIGSCSKVFFNFMNSMAC